MNHLAKRKSGFFATPAAIGRIVLRGVKALHVAINDQVDICARVIGEADVAHVLGVWFNDLVVFFLIFYILDGLLVALFQLRVTTEESAHPSSVLLALALTSGMCLVHSYFELIIM